MSRSDDWSPNYDRQETLQLPQLYAGEMRPLFSGDVARQSEPVGTDDSRN